MDLYDEVHYRKESEIDNAFKYLDELDKEIKELNDKLSLKTNSAKTTNKKQKFTLFNFFTKNNNKIEKIEIKEKRKLLKSSDYKKDGYIFKIRLYRVCNELDNSTLYFEFYSNIIYVNDKRKKQFYKQIFNEDDAKKYFEDMSAVFKILKRRDLMEKLFDFKLEEIAFLKKSLINR